MKLLVLLLVGVVMFSANYAEVDGSPCSSGKYIIRNFSLVETKYQSFIIRNSATTCPGH